MGRGRRLLGLGALIGGAAAGAALEEVLYRRVFRARDGEADEAIGSVPATTSWTTAGDGTRLYTRTYGPADAKASIVFAHGIVENHLIWHYVVRDLRLDGRFRLVAYDARGHGNSGPARGPEGTTPFNGDTLGRDLASVIEQAAVGPVIVVGHSLGGMTALTQLILDKLERERIAGAVIVNSTFTAELGNWKGKHATTTKSLDRASAFVEQLFGDHPERLDRLRMGATDLSVLVARGIFGKRPSPRHIAVAFHMFETTSSQTLTAAIDIATFDVHADLERIDVPTLVVSGSHDLLTPLFLSKELADRIPGAELVVFDGCGHMAPFERHDELVAEIRKFADEVLV